MGENIPNWWWLIPHKRGKRRKIFISREFCSRRTEIGLISEHIFTSLSPPFLLFLWLSPDPSIHPSSSSILFFEFRPVISYSSQNTIVSLTLGSVKKLSWRVLVTFVFLYFYLKLFRLLSPMDEDDVIRWSDVLKAKVLSDDFLPLSRFFYLCWNCGSDEGDVCRMVDDNDDVS